MPIPRVLTRCLSYAALAWLLAAPSLLIAEVNAPDYSAAIQQIEQAVREEMQEWGITGIALALVDDQQVLQANALLGQTVGLKSDDGGLATGVVSAVQIESGIPMIIVNGLPFDLSQVATITHTSANP